MSQVYFWQIKPKLTGKSFYKKSEKTFLREKKDSGFSGSEGKKKKKKICLLISLPPSANKTDEESLASQAAISLNYKPER